MFFWKGLQSSQKEKKGGRRRRRKEMILKENIWKTAIAMMSQLQQAQGEMFLGTDLGSASLSQS
jgi:hypothetical protein